MLQLEKRFERPMINFGRQEPPIRHYPIAEVLLGQPVWHIVGVLPKKEPDGSTYARRTHFVTTKAGLAGAILQENPWREATVLVVLPPTFMQTTNPAVARCIGIWEGHDRDTPSLKGWGWETEEGSYADPSDGLDILTVVKDKMLWKEAK